VALSDIAEQESLLPFSRLTSPFFFSHLFVLSPECCANPKTLLESWLKKEGPSSTKWKRNRDHESMFRCNVNAPAGQWGRGTIHQTTSSLSLSFLFFSSLRCEMLTPARRGAKTRREHRFSCRSIRLI